MFRRIKIGVGVIEASALFVKENMLILLMPLTNLLSIVLYIFFWLYVMVYLYSNGEVDKT